MIVEVARRYKFRASHEVEGLAAPWNQRHEHDYTVEVVARGHAPIVVDTDALDLAWADDSRFDGCHLNDSVGGPTTVEDLAVRLLALFRARVAQVVAVTVWEDDDRWGRASC